MHINCLILCFREFSVRKAFRRVNGKARRPPFVSSLLPRRPSQFDDKESTISANKGSDHAIKQQAFTFQELADVTENFSPEHLVDVGNFGKIYRGKLKETGEIIVVEQLDRYGSRGQREFLLQVMMLSFLNHPNLINLIGYCTEGDKRFLVHEYLPLGSLDQHLHDRPSKQKPLDWYTRMKIALGIAKGLEYMHHNASPPVIYRNLKPSNILLDKNFKAKLSDFGLSKLGPSGEKKYVSTSVVGTYGYIAPEYQKTGFLTMKADVYSFGVVLLELVTGRRAVDITKQTKEQNLVSWAHQILKEPSKFTELADPALQGNFPANGFNQALAVAAMCLQEEQTARPMMSDVITAIMYLSSGNLDDSIHSPPPEPV
ncbi:probable serine/threonine-protein kinase PBL24 [Chenopodium quinoa]|uniref:probable serine/threonine-protein kinase PBL24 n=1 Tax=Chenopodium quinoa TaxID=63459 RepID=UPI000B77F025|nr:probable serine/threonine-protein kinase PBL24 [Chenopodium quinoa]